MKFLLSIGLVLIWASLLDANSLRDVLALGNGNEGLRIVGGRDAKPHEFPYIVALTMHMNDGVVKTLCGGSILNERWVLSSAHCFTVMYLGYYEIRAGAHYLNETMEGEQSSLVSRKIIHPNFDPESIKTSNDVALVELKTPFTFSETVQPIALPPQDEFPLEGLATVSGWGLIYKYEEISTNTLQTIMLPVITNDDCRAIVKDVGTVNSFEFCTFEAEKGVCNGDSGGPLVQNNKIIGIVKRGWGMCNRWPSVYERVSFYTNWINSNIY